MSDATCWIDFETMTAFMTDVFVGLGVPADEAAVCSDVLITADKRGVDSHGVGRLKPIYYDRIVHHKVQYPTTDMKIVREIGATAVVDGGHGMGMVVSQRCMQMAIDKAKEFGVGVVVSRNSTHYGMAAYYPMMACDAGMIGMTATNARPSIAPTFGVENMLGTNPLVFAMPTDEPFVFTNDYATSISQRGKIEKYARDNQPLPEGWVIDRQGRPMTDPHKVLDALVAGQAALCPIGGLGEENGGYKGYGYATVVEILSSALQQGAFMKQLSGFDAEGNRAPYCLGHFFMAMNVEAFTDLDAFKKTTGDILRALRSSERAPGEERIYTCGEKEHVVWEERKDKGVPVGDVLQKQMVEMRDELGLTQYSFPFEG
jgi:L-2-hydroxycarboxylate dehydrogenase (NAD+)